MAKLLKKPLQIYLDPAQDRALRAVASRSGLSVAAIIRQSVDLYLSQAVPAAEDPSLELIGLGRSGRSDLAEKHDQVFADEVRGR
ncbi:MAG: ribbon-helix-helix protein, CopG family [Chloroflexota bacterium]|nr:ribbon-helix-helix protein, CopG family [Chloroflexota bacterium]